MHFHVLTYECTNKLASQYQLSAEDWPGAGRQSCPSFSTRRLNYATILQEKCMLLKKKAKNL